MSKLSEQLANKIERDLGIKVAPDTFVSIRPKPSYKIAGAWSWEIEVIGPRTVNSIWRIGSMWTATECIRKNVKLVAAEPHPACCRNEIEIVPENINAK